MSTTRLQAVLRVLHRSRRTRECSQELLLERFVSTGDEDAFAELVRRNGPMVLAVCRRLVGDQHDAEDAFQSTFLVLASRAASIRPASQLPNWLHGVARHVALRLRSQRVRRHKREVPLLGVPEPEVTDPSSQDLRDILDEELAWLSPKYRIAILLCDLQGLSHREAASQLGWPIGTLASRHSRGRQMLRKRLLRRGFESAEAVPVLPAGGEFLSPSLASSTVLAARHWTAQRMVDGVLSPAVTTLTQGVLQSMTTCKMKIGILSLLLLGLSSLGTLLLAGQPAPPSQKTDIPRQQHPIRASTPPSARLQIQATGKRVHVIVSQEKWEIDLIADRLKYEEGGPLLLQGNVRWIRKGNPSETGYCEKLLLHRSSGKMDCESVGHKVFIPLIGPAILYPQSSRLTTLDGVEIAISTPSTVPEQNRIGEKAPDR